jgi:hypothetical protein
MMLYASETGQRTELPERIRMAIRDVNLLLAAVKYIPVRPVNEDDTLLVHLKNIGTRSLRYNVSCGS